MTSGTKILLTLIGLFVVTLVVYYGFVMPAPEAPTAVVVDPALGPSPEPPIDRPRDRAADASPAPFAPEAEADEAAATNETDAAPAPPLERDPLPAMRPGLQPIEPAPPPRAAVTTPERPDRPATTYVVKEGDTLSSIAAWWFGEHARWDLIAEANRIDPHRLRIGQKLRMPAKDAAAAPSSPPPGPEARSERTERRARIHVVSPGDTLSAIARTHYGDVRRWEAVYEANVALIGAHPDALRVGTRLVIP